MLKRTKVRVLIEQVFLFSFCLFPLSFALFPSLGVFFSNLLVSFLSPNFLDVGLAAHRRRADESVFVQKPCIRVLPSGEVHVDNAETVSVECHDEIGDLFAEVLAEASSPLSHVVMTVQMEVLFPLRIPTSLVEIFFVSFIFTALLSILVCIFLTL